MITASVRLSTRISDDIFRTLRHVAPPSGKSARIQRGGALPNGEHKVPNILLTKTYSVCHQIKDHTHTKALPTPDPPVDKSTISMTVPSAAGAHLNA